MGYAIPFLVCRNGFTHPTFDFTRLLAGLRFKKVLVQQTFRESMMRESVIAQEILQEERQEGVTLVLRQLTRWFGAIDESIQSQLATLPLPRLEDRSEALLVAVLTDWMTWLQAHSHEQSHAKSA